MTPDDTYRTFRRLMGQTFRMHLSDTLSVPIVLTACDPTGPGGNIASFSLTFKSGPDAPIQQGSYLLSADGFAPQPVFLVPLRRLSDDPDFAVEYEAVFNRLPR